MVRALLRRLLQREQLVGAQVALVVARARRRRGSARARPRAPSAPAWTRAEHTSRHGRPVRRRRRASARPDTRRSRCGCGRRRSTSSSARSTCSARARRSAWRSRRTAFGSTDLLRPAREREDDAGADRRRATGAAFEELSAVSATVADVRGVLARARERLGAQGQRTILFLDEIHRFNKAQQDALLPAVEEGLVTLIGATTENPYFEVNSALLSRVQLYELAAARARRPRAGRRARGGSARRRSCRPSSARWSPAAPAATRATR